MGKSSFSEEEKMQISMEMRNDYYGLTEKWRGKVNPPVFLSMMLSFITNDALRRAPDVACAVHMIQEVVTTIVKEWGNDE
jgi:hypothetical protein